MSKHFFERTTTVTGETVICVGQLKLSPTDTIKILQALVIRKDAVNANTYYQTMLTRAANTLPASVANGIQEIVNPLYLKLLAFFRVLISMDDGSPLQQVELTSVEASLMEVDSEIKRLFNQYAWTIATLKVFLIPLFQFFLQDSGTKKQIPEAFKQHSISPILSYMVNTEYATFGIATPAIPSATTGNLHTTDSHQLDRVLHKISALECRLGVDPDNEIPIIRDLAYLRVLSTEDFYYPGNEVSEVWKKCRLDKLSTESLSFMITQLMTYNPPWAHETQDPQRTTLQMLAVLHALYRNIALVSLSEKDLASILLALSQSHIALQWQLDVHQTAPEALLLYISLLCLRGGVVHIEQAERLLALDNESGIARTFLKSLNILYTHCPRPASAKLGVLHRKQTKLEAKTYYFGSQTLCFSSHPVLKMYLAQALLEIKQQILQPFDAWYSLLRTSDVPTTILLQYRATLLDNVEKTWIQYIPRHRTHQSLQSVDRMIEKFQQVILEIWQETERELVAMSGRYSVSKRFQARLNFLHQNSTQIYQSLSTRHYARYGSSLAAIVIEEPVIMTQILNARLYYEQIYWSDTDRLQWVNSYLKRQIIRLQRLCPELRKVPVPSDYLKLCVEHLAEKPRDHTLSAELNAAMQLCVSLYHSLEGILLWSAEPSIQANIAYLSAVTSHSSVKNMAQKLISQTQWVTQTDNFYYQWLESNTVKLAAEKLYAAAQSLSADPDNTNFLSVFLHSLTEHQKILAHNAWYIPWGWFWGYSDIRTVIADSLHQVGTMVTLQQIPHNLLHEAEESARWISLLQCLQDTLDGIRVSSNQRRAWNEFLQHIQLIQSTTFGIERVVEIRSYLDTKRQKFVLTQHGFFYGPRHTDQIETVLNMLDEGLRSAGHSVQKVFADRDFLARKALQIRRQNNGVTDVRILPGYGGEQFFDVWITSIEAIPDFQSDQRVANTWFKRFYHVTDFFAFVREERVAQEAISRPIEADRLGCAVMGSPVFAMR